MAFAESQASIILLASVVESPRLFFSRSRVNAKDSNIGSPVQKTLVYFLDLS